MKTKQQGFTLIELVVVIVILGILAVTVAPRFLNLQGDAHRGVLEAVNGSLQSANSMINSKAILANQTGATGSVNISTTATAVNVTLAHGRMAATTANLIAVLDIDASADAANTTSEYVVASSGATGPVTIRLRAAKASCTLTYTQAADADTPPTYAVAAAANC